jgi:hypothetical protein
MLDNLNKPTLALSTLERLWGVTKVRRRTKIKHIPAIVLQFHAHANRFAFMFTRVLAVGSECY